MKPSQESQSDAEYDSSQSVTPFLCISLEFKSSLWELGLPHINTVLKKAKCKGPWNRKPKKTKTYDWDNVESHFDFQKFPSCWTNFSLRKRTSPLICFKLSCPEIRTKLRCKLSLTVRQPSLSSRKLYYFCTKQGQKTPMHLTLQWPHTALPFHRHIAPSLVCSLLPECNYLCALFLNLIY